jgi:hypothetical protein
MVPRNKCSVGATDACFYAFLQTFLEEVKHLLVYLTEIPVRKNVLSELEKASFTSFSHFV